MRFYDLIMRDKSISLEDKKRLEGNIVVVADNVASYYYEGTDKEVWNFSDFPNIAPPFEQFWLECAAPKQCVSKEKGTRVWDRQMPTYWGFLCKAHLIESAKEQLSIKSRRQALIEALKEQFKQLHKGLKTMVPDYSNMFYKKGMEYTKEHTSERDYALILEVMAIVEAIAYLEKDNIEEAERVLTSLYPHKWQVDVELWHRMSIFKKDQIFPDIYGWSFSVMPNGTISYQKETGIPMVFARIGDAGSMMNDLVESGLSVNEVLHMADNSFNPFLQILFLSFSFMHCKNVALNETIPPLRVPHNKSAKRRGEQPFQPVMFKTLDIKPMRQILKTEGREDTIGTQQALHICRGHFKHYEEGRGLFGKHHGTFWFPMHTRGALDKGTIVKDYRISQPERIITQ